MSLNPRTAFMLGAAASHGRHLNTRINKPTRVVNVTSEPKQGGLKQLCDAAKDGALLAAKTILSRDVDRVDVNQYCPKYNPHCTALFLASQEGHVQVITLLLENGAKVDLGDDSSRSPLWMAASKGHLEAVRVLVGAKANLEQKYSNLGRTPLAIAAAEGHVPTVECLVQAKAQVDCCDSDEDTPLIEAVLNNRLDLVNVLLKGGADPKRTRKNGASPLYLAAEKKLLPIAESLIKAGAPVSFGFSDHSGSPLHKAAATGHIEMAQFLLDQGAEVNCQTKKGHSPLYLGC